MKHPHLLLVFLVGAGFGAALLAILGRSHPKAAEAHEARPLAGIAELAREISELSSRIDAHTATSSESVPALRREANTGTARTSDHGPLDFATIQSELREIRVALSTLQSRAGVTSELLKQTLRNNPPTNRAAVKHFYDRHKRSSSEDTAIDEWQLRSLAAVIRHFGAPDKVLTEDTMLSLVYHPNETDDWDSLRFGCRDGVVYELKVD